MIPELTHRVCMHFTTVLLFAEVHGVKTLVNKVAMFKAMLEKDDLKMWFRRNIQ